MVLKFRFISNEQDNFVRDFEILADQTFFDLHMAIQGNLHFDKSQIASFFICGQKWEKEQEITLFELTEEESARVITMENAGIKDHVHEVHDKMVYVFDVFNERMFFIELVGKNTRDASKNYPVCCFEKGQAPQQLLMDHLFGTPNLSDSSILEDYTDDPGLDLQIYDDEFPDDY
ncbi:MAG TPA: hypothetical protein ENI20_17230 [Bacteroides sp.]|nr:hypothetical protein [Bacteroides sp.]